MALTVKYCMCMMWKMSVCRYFYMFNYFFWVNRSAGRTGRTPGTGWSPSVAPAKAGSSWRQEIGDEGDRDNDGSGGDRDAADSGRSLERRRRRKKHGEERWMKTTLLSLSLSGQGPIKFDLIHLAACRCRATAAAPSEPPSAWSTRPHDPRSPAGCGPPSPRGPSERRQRSPRRTVLTDRQRFNTTSFTHQVLQRFIVVSRTNIIPHSLTAARGDYSGECGWKKKCNSSETELWLQYTQEIKMNVYFIFQGMNVNKFGDPLIFLLQQLKTSTRQFIMFINL